MQFSNLLSLYLILSLAISGIAFQWSGLGWWTAVPVCGILIWIVSEFRGVRVRLFAAPPYSQKTVLNLCLGLVIWLPSLLYFGLSYHQEFPFMGDHAHHLRASLKVLALWKSIGWTMLGAVGACVLFYRRWKKPLWSLIAFFAFLCISKYTPEIRVLARYPGGFYAWTMPFQALYEWMGWRETLNANRWASVLSIGGWLFVLRPFILGRWPSWSLLPLGLFLFFQKGFVYFASTSYLDVSAIVLCLLGLEAAWTERLSRPWLGCLICGFACMFKEQSVFALMIAWTLGYGEPLFIQKKWKFSDWRGPLLIGATAATPFSLYWLLKTRTKIHPLEFGGASAQVFSAARFSELALRIREMLGSSGYALLLILAVFWFLAFLRRPKWRLMMLLTLGAALMIEAVEFTDQISQAWTGYPRYHLFPLAIGAFPLLAVGEDWFEKKHFRELAVLCGLILVGNLPVLILSAQRELRSEFDRNFIEYNECPVFLPVRSLMEGAIRLGMINPAPGHPQVIQIHQPVPPIFFQDNFFIGYRDLIGPFDFFLWKDTGVENCTCTPEHQFQMVLIADTDAGVFLNPTRVKQDQTPWIRCAERAASTCNSVFWSKAGSGKPIGVFGAGVRAE